VPQSGVAGILKRVLGDRIEQRRKAVRASLKALSSGAVPTAQLLPNDPAFTPTGKDRITVSGVSTVTGTGLSGLSGLSSAGGTSPSAIVHSPLEPSQPGVPRRAPRRRLSTASVLGYAIGLTGLAIALFVLLFMR
jgi:hypothetical protein